MTTPKWKSATVLALLLAAGNINAFAVHGGGGPSGGMSAGHISAQGIRNTNGPASLDRDKGLDRAEDRRSLQGTEHGKALGKAKHHRQVTHR